MHRIVPLALFAVAVTSSYETRVKSLQAEAEAQRKKLGFDDYQKRDKLYAQFPTPEVTFEGEPKRVSCGDTATLSLKGKYPKGTAFLLNDDDVQVVEEKATADGWQAKVKVAPAAAPASVMVYAIAPVSGANISSKALTIRARYDLDLKFDDGWTAHFTTAQADKDSGQLGGTLDWQKGGETRQLRAEIDASGISRLRVRTGMSEEENKLTEEELESGRALGGEEMMQKAMGRVEECVKKSDPARTACLEAASKKNDAEGEAWKKKLEAHQAAFEARRPKAAWTCHDIDLRAAAGALSGKASCGRFNDRELKVTGTLRCTGAIKGD